MSVEGFDNQEEFDAALDKWEKEQENAGPNPFEQEISAVRSQIVVLNVVYIDEASKPPPVEWNWDELVDEPIRGAVEVLAAGPVNNHPRPGEEEL
jgi:hypothetical protein